MPSDNSRKAVALDDLQLLEPGRSRAPGYYAEIDRLYARLVSPGMRVLEVGCGTGRLLASLRPRSGLGVDVDPQKVSAARRLHEDHPELAFEILDAEAADWHGHEPFDYIILSDLVPALMDVQNVLERLRSVCKPSTRVVISSPSNLWRPLLSWATRLRRRQFEKRFDWLSRTDIENLLYLAGFEVVTTGEQILVPVRIPVVSAVANRFLAKLPGLRHLCLVVYLVARPQPSRLGCQSEPSVSVVIPTRDERDNIEAAFQRTPHMGAWTELIFVDGHSTDGTVEEIERCIEKYGNQWQRVVLLHQTGKGKGQAVRQGFAESRGEILMILDSDLTMPPEELPKYYEALVSGRGELINGCRLVYLMEKEAMRFLNMIANYAFGHLFSWLMGQPVKDTLCGTKVLWQTDYEQIAANRAYFGDFDPFGDFDLLFGAARLNRKIVDMPIRYRERAYGDIKIQRWRHGLLLLRMSFLGFRKLKLQ